MSRSPGLEWSALPGRLRWEERSWSTVIPWRSRPQGARLQGVSALYEYTVAKRLSVVVTTTEPLIRGGQVAFGDTCPGFKVRFNEESRRLPLLAVTYALKVPTAGTGFGTGLYDHKVVLQADKGIGRTRWTGNFATTWAARKDGTRARQYMPSLSALTPVAWPVG